MANNLNNYISYKKKEILRPKLRRSRNSERETRAMIFFKENN